MLQLEQILSERQTRTNAGEDIEKGIHNAVSARIKVSTAIMQNSIEVPKKTN